jgi:hypothetical protein
MAQSSSDGGYNWSTENNITSGYGTWGGNGVSFVKADNGELFVFAESGTGTYEMGLFRSQDDGNSWSFLSGATNKTRKWYGQMCYNRKDEKIICIGQDQATGTVSWVTQWDIVGSSFDFVQTAVPTTGYAAHDRAIGSGAACDNEGNVIFWVRVRYTADSLYRLWEHKWASGSAVSSATGTIVTAGGSNQVYGTIQCSRDGIFHKFATPGASTAGAGIYYSKGTFGSANSFTQVLTPESTYNSNQIAIYLNNHNEEAMSEFHAAYLQHDGSSTYYLYHDTDIVRFVGQQTILPIGY